MFPTGYNNNVQILQAPGYVTVTHEMMHDTRIIPLDGRPHLSPAIRQYMGDSRGHWDGNTLVIDVTNFHPNTNYRGIGRHAAPHRALHANGEGRASVRGDDRRPAHVRTSVDSRARSGAAGAHVRIRVPRGQPRARERPVLRRVRKNAQSARSASRRPALPDQLLMSTPASPRPRTFTASSQARLDEPVIVVIARRTHAIIGLGSCGGPLTSAPIVPEKNA